VLFGIIGCSSSESQNIRTQYETELLQLEARSAVQNGRYSSAIRLLDFLPDFPEANFLRGEAENGIFREGIINEITEALAFGRYEDVLEVIDSNPQFIDDMGFREGALAGIIRRDAAEAAQQPGDIAMLSSMISEMFQIATLEIESRNQTMEVIEPRGFANPGTITLIFEFDSRIRLGVADPMSIEMRSEGYTVYINTSSIQIEVLESSASSFELIAHFRSNPLVSFTAAVTEQMFDAQNALEEEMTRRLVNETTIESARRSFKNSLEGFMRGMGLIVIWE